MENEGKLQKVLGRITDALNEQQWYQELRAKWDGLDAQAQMIVKVGTIAGSIFLVFILTLNSLWRVYSLKETVNEKKELLAYIDQATIELQELKKNQGSTDFSEATPWKEYFSTQIQQVGVEVDAIEISEPKNGESTDQAQELFFEITLKHINVRQLTKLGHSLESGNRPVKLRNLSVTTQKDLSGYLDATIALSAFNLEAE